jgi:hypothetical protein
MSAATGTFAILAKAQRNFSSRLCNRNTTPFEIQQDIDDVFLHAVNGRILVQTPAIVTSVAAWPTMEDNKTRRSAWQMCDHSRARGSRLPLARLRQLLNVDSFGFNKLVCMQSFSIPSVRYTDTEAETPWRYGAPYEN